MPENLIGHVLDIDGRPIKGVDISLKGKVVASSSKDGFFSVAPAKGESRVALTFAAEGYVSNTRVYSSKATGIKTVYIAPVGYRVKFDASRELDIELGPSRIQVPANALTDPNGKRVSGPAELQFTWFDVTNRLQRLAAPGDFSGQLRDGGIRRLNSYGIFDLALQDAKGRRLGLRPGTKVGLSIVVPARLRPTAPKRVGFFDFDARIGRWKQVGDFALARGKLTYNGYIDRFAGPDGSTAHNLDDPQDTVCVKLRVVSAWDGSPMAYFAVTAHGAQYDSHGTSDVDGYVCLLVQRNASVSATAEGGTAQSTWMTPPGSELAFTSPDFSSGADSCGDDALCPFMGNVPVDLLVN